MARIDWSYLTANTPSRGAGVSAPSAEQREQKRKAKARKFAAKKAKTEVPYEDEQGAAMEQALTPEEQAEMGFQGSVPGLHTGEFYTDPDKYAAALIEGGADDLAREFQKDQLDMAKMRVELEAKRLHMALRVQLAVPDMVKSGWTDKALELTNTAERSLNIPEEEMTASFSWDEKNGNAIAVDKKGNRNPINRQAALEAAAEPKDRLDYLAAKYSAMMQRLTPKKTGRDQAAIDKDIVATTKEMMVRTYTPALAKLSKNSPQVIVNAKGNDKFIREVLAVSKLPQFENSPTKAFSEVSKYYFLDTGERGMERDNLLGIDEDPEFIALPKGYDNQGQPVQWSVDEINELAQLAGMEPYKLARLSFGQLVSLAQDIRDEMKAGKK